MKKIIIIILFTFIFTKNVVAINEQNVTKILYKWYKEEKIEGLFYPKEEKLIGYLEDENNIQYGEYSEWNNNYCYYSKDYYILEEKNITTYDELLETKYIILRSLYNIGTSDDFKIIKIYYDNTELDYTINEYSAYTIELELDKEYDTGKLEFYIDTNDIRYFILLYNDSELKKLVISYSVVPRHDGKKLIWNEDWISEVSSYKEKETEETIEESKTIKNIRTEKKCRVREINTYRYKINKIYYDNEYHLYIDGYIPDITDSIIYYYNNEIEQENKSKETNNFILQNEIKNQKEVIKNTSFSQSISKIITKDIIKKKTSKKTYILIIILIIIIIFETVKIIRKKVD